MKRILFYFFFSSFLFTACNWLDIVPEEDMTTIDTDFETRDEAENWLLSCHMFLQGTVPDFFANEAFIGADEFVACDYVRSGLFDGLYISSGLQSVLDPYCDVWSKRASDGRTDYYTAINLCNIFIDKIDQVYNLDKKDKEEWKAEVKALKAYYYFELVRHYGPIILVPENIDPNADIETMKEPRSHVDSCFQAIVDLCDEAKDVLPHFNEKETSRRCFFNRDAVYALKARALLYQASPLFNGNPAYADFKNKKGELLFNPVPDPAKWRRAAEAAEEAIRVCEEGGRHLVKGEMGNTTLQTHIKNVQASVLTFNYTNDEVLWMIKRHGENQIYNYILPKIPGTYGRSSGGSLGPSLAMVEMFYTKNGLPIDADKEWVSGSRYSLTKQADPAYLDVVVQDEEVLYLHTMREPRFYADIAADRCYWQQGPDLKSLRLVEMYQGEDFGLQEKRVNPALPQNLSGYWLKKWLTPKAQLTNYTSDIRSFGTEVYPVIRMAELYLIAAEAWNECGEEFRNKVYENLNVVRERAGIPDVEEAWENYSTAPARVKSQAGLRDIIKQEWNIEYAFEGMRFWNLRRWLDAEKYLNADSFGWNVAGKNAAVFYGNGPVAVYNKNKFIAPRDYFWPIRSEEIQISGCVQNPGW